MKSTNNSFLLNFVIKAKRRAQMNKPTSSGLNKEDHMARLETSVLINLPANWEKSVIFPFGFSRNL